MNKKKDLILSCCFLLSYFICFTTTIFANETNSVDIYIDSINKSLGTYDVLLVEPSNQKNITKMKVAIWSDEGGQDDLRWYEARYDDNGKMVFHFNIKNHKSKSGHYITHVYTTDKNGHVEGKNLGQIAFNISKPKVETEADGFVISNTINPTNGYLMTAIWSDERGQDDLKWYRHDSEGEIVAPYVNHKGFGTYHAHTYWFKNSSSSFIGSQTLTLNKSQLNYQMTKIRDTAYQVTINNVPQHMRNILVPIWSDKNGQDDLKWYQATKIDATTYQVIVPLKNHRFNLGHYNVHLYGRSDLYTGLKGLQSTSGFSVDAITSYDSPQMGSSMTNSNQFSVTVNETEHSKVIKQISVAVWSDANQGNLKWYQSQHANNGSFLINADVKNHANKSGLYHVHVYITYNDGETRGFPLSQVSLSARIETSYAYFSQYYMPSNYQNLLTYKSPTSRTIYGGYDNIGTSYSQGQCTFYVYNRIRETHGLSVYRWLGNGQDWVNSLTSQGWHRSNQPSVGAVLSVKGGHDYTLPQYGHVAFVEHVNPDGSFLISELNYNEVQTKVHWRVLRPQFYYSFASYQ
ncbi:GBS Bsp-like repeat-containing protein [Streptococcus zalophi]|uniref:GBS Bsp-like repeat-containing protein n=1 Tax=Streptococcus zalophi TaxID=640031 RepID=A0A934P8S6_9STRE|nr:GBS Bsp-like repeat-containing protein [Streptococcus zalophi]MBJ8349042.1 GBS Bsp-like repeat-containing protein [Streptococcus zalophi]MCR8967807.1 GBS Bsp-like repeat-containing protein [Streptococcus zalophi]